MKFSELLGEDQPAEMPTGPNGRPPDVPALVDEVAAAPTPADAALDSQLDALPGPDAGFADEVAPEPTPVRFGEPVAPAEPEPYPPLEPAAFEAPAVEPPAVEPAAFEAPAVEPPAPVEPPEPFIEASAPEPFIEAAPLDEVPPLDAFAPVARPTPTSVFGGGRVEQSTGLSPLSGSEPAEPELDDDAMRIARLDVIDDDILPTTRKRSKR